MAQRFFPGRDPRLLPFMVVVIGTRRLGAWRAGVEVGRSSSSRLRLGLGPGVGLGVAVVVVVTKEKRVVEDGSERVSGAWGGKVVEEQKGAFGAQGGGAVSGWRIEAWLACGRRCGRASRASSCCSCCRTTRRGNRRHRQQRSSGT